MMFKKEFKTEVASNISKYLPTDFSNWDVKVVTVNKVNETLDAICIYPPENNLPSPVIYIDEFYRYYQENESLDETLKMISDYFVESMKVTLEFNFREKQSFGESELILQLINTEKSEELLKNVPSRKWLNLSIIYRLVVIGQDQSVNSAIVTNQYAEEMGWSEEHLFKCALENFLKILKVESYEIPFAFKVITTNHHIFGASLLLYKDIWEKEAAELGSDLYLVPSSIHEVLVVPKDEDRREFLYQTLWDCNEKVVENNEILCDTIYQYSRKENVVTIA